MGVKRDLFKGGIYIGLFRIFGGILVSFWVEVDFLCWWMLIVFGLWV